MQPRSVRVSGKCLLAAPSVQPGPAGKVPLQKLTAEHSAQERARVVTQPGRVGGTVITDQQAQQWIEALQASHRALSARGAAEDKVLSAHKIQQMWWCLAESAREECRDWLRGQANMDVGIMTDARGHCLLVRFRACNDRLELRSGCASVWKTKCFFGRFLLNGF